MIIYIYVLFLGWEIADPDVPFVGDVVDNDDDDVFDMDGEEERKEDNAGYNGHEVVFPDNQNTSSDVIRFSHPVLSSHIARFGQYFGGAQPLQQEHETTIATYDRPICPQEPEDQEELLSSKRPKLNDNKPMDEEFDIAEL